MPSGILYIVATPIGNLDDISARALATLRQADLILCEDTRVTKKLLDRFEITVPCSSYHQHSGPTKTREIVAALGAGKTYALVTDAGTPGISDPGNLLVAEVVKRDPTIGIVPIPGACAAVTALSVSGLPTDKFLFLGFPPHKNKRQKFFQQVAASQQTVVFYESGHRIIKCLQQLRQALEPARSIVICRELTKQFEAIYRGTVSQLADTMQEERGEFVVIIAGTRL